MRKLLGLSLLAMGLVCLSGRAEAQVPCVTNAQCSFDSGIFGETCEMNVPMSSPQCGCTMNTECPSPLVCVVQTAGQPGFCNDKPCMVNTDCAMSPFGHVCFPGGFGCGCMTDTDCPTPKVCNGTMGQAGFCVDPPCMTATDCMGNNFGQVC